MCGRFALSKSDRIDWAQFGVRRGPALPPHWNLGPGRDIAAVRDAGNGPELAMLRWGLVPFWAKDPSIGNRLSNARSESVADKPAFRAAVRQRRCLILADGFYEWQVVAGSTRKQPWFVRRADERVFALAGLWERWIPAKGTGTGTGAGSDSALETCAVLTTEPNELMRTIHSRMPVIIGAEDYAEWLAPNTPSARVSALMAAWDPAAWIAHRVSMHVNAVANDDAACVTPLGSDGASR
jgi:putative SOS response-associated peptidase YedK